MTGNKEMWKHQEIARMNAKLLPFYGLFFKPGAGKSKASIDILRDKFNAHGEILRTLIFTVPNVVPQFQGEWYKFSKIDPKKVILLQGSGADRLEKFLYHTNDRKGKVFITNWEALLMKPLFQAFRDWSPQAIVFDESQKAKSIKAERAKLADILANPFDQKRPKIKLTKPYTYVLSGTPMLQSPMDIFQQFKIMDGGRTFGTNFYIFRTLYFKDVNANIPKERNLHQKWLPKTLEEDGFDALKALQDRIQNVCMYADIEKYLPPLLVQNVPCAMSKEQARLYKELKRDYLTFFKNAPCTADLAITKSLRLMQIVSGFISTERPGLDTEPVETELEGTGKYGALKEKLTAIVEAGEKVLIWAVYKPNYATIRRACEEVARETKIDFKFVEVHGEVTSEKQRLENIKQFQQDPETKVYLGHPDSGGIGLNLVQAAYSIFYSRTHALGHYLQAIKRNHRGGSTEQGHTNITVYNLCCTGTIDELIIEDLSEKEKTSDAIFVSGRKFDWTDQQAAEFLKRMEAQKY